MIKDDVIKGSHCQILDLAHSPENALLLNYRKAVFKQSINSCLISLCLKQLNFCNTCKIRKK